MSSETAEILATLLFAVGVALWLTFAFLMPLIWADADEMRERGERK